MKNKLHTYEVVIKATITKVFEVEAADEDAAEAEAEEMFDPHSGEAEEKYTQEILRVTRL
jgi:hypothetical protein